MRNEKYYGVFDYGDELTPGSELKIEHTVVQDYYDNQSIPLYRTIMTIKLIWFLLSAWALRAYQKQEIRALKRRK